MYSKTDAYAIFCSSANSSFCFNKKDNYLKEILDFLIEINLRIKHGFKILGLELFIILSLIIFFDLFRFF